MTHFADILTGPVGWTLLACWLLIEWCGGRMWAWWNKVIEVSEFDPSTRPAWAIPLPRRQGGYSSTGPPVDPAKLKPPRGDMAVEPLRPLMQYNQCDGKGWQDIWSADVL